MDVELWEVFETAFRQGCGRDIKEVVRSERFRARLNDSQNAASRFAPESLEAQAYRAGYLNFGALLHIKPGVETFAEAANLPPSPPDPMIQALVTELGDSLIEAAALCFPPEFQALAERYPNESEEGKSAIWTWMFWYLSNLGQQIESNERAFAILNDPPQAWTYHPQGDIVRQMKEKLHRIRRGADENKSWMDDLLDQPMERLFPLLHGELKWTSDYNCWSKTQLMAGFARMLGVRNYCVVPLVRNERKYRETHHELAQSMSKFLHDIAAPSRFHRRIELAIRNFRDWENRPWPLHGSLLCDTGQRLLYNDPNFQLYMNLDGNHRYRADAAMDVLDRYHEVLPGLSVTFPTLSWNPPDLGPSFFPFMAQFSELASALNALAHDANDEDYLAVILCSTLAKETLTKLSEGSQTVSGVDQVLQGVMLFLSGLNGADQMNATEAFSPLDFSGQLYFAYHSDRLRHPAASAVINVFGGLEEWYRKNQFNIIHPVLEVWHPEAGIAWGALSHVGCLLGRRNSEAIEQCRVEQSYGQFGLLHAAGRALREGRNFQSTTEQNATRYLRQLPDVHSDARSVLERLDSLGKRDESDVVWDKRQRKVGPEGCSEPGGANGSGSPSQQPGIQL